MLVVPYNSPNEDNCVAPSHIRSRSLKHVYKDSNFILTQRWRARGGECAVACSLIFTLRVEDENKSVNMVNMCTKVLGIW